MLFRSDKLQERAEKLGRALRLGHTFCGGAPGLLPTTRLTLGDSTLRFALPKRHAALLGEKIERASPVFVKEMTGYEVGGVPPLAHDRPCTVYIDRDLGAFPSVWAAGGTANAVFAIGFEALVVLSGATVADIAKKA